MLSYFLLPILIGGCYWIIHKSKGELTARNNYRRRKLFGIILLVTFILSIMTLLFLASDGFYSSSLLARRTMWLFLSISVGWRWMRTVWTPFAKIQLETDSPQGLGEAISCWKHDVSKRLGLDKPREPKKKPCEYYQDSKVVDAVNSSKAETNQSNSNNKSIAEKLEEFRELYENGLISEDEYIRLKSKELGI